MDLHKCPQFIYRINTCNIVRLIDKFVSYLTGAEIFIPLYFTMTIILLSDKLSTIKG